MEEEYVPPPFDALGIKAILRLAQRDLFFGTKFGEEEAYAAMCRIAYHGDHRAGVARVLLERMVVEGVKARLLE